MSRKIRAAGMEIGVSSRGERQPPDVPAAAVGRTSRGQVGIVGVTWGGGGAAEGGGTAVGGVGAPPGSCSTTSVMRLMWEPANCQVARSQQVCAQSPLRVVRLLSTAAVTWLILIGETNVSVTLRPNSPFHQMAILLRPRNWRPDT